MGLRERTSRSARHLVREALRSVGPSTELLVDLAGLRQQVEANTQQIEQTRMLLEVTIRRMDEVAQQVDAFASTLRAQNASQLEWSGSMQDMDRRLSKLGDAVGSLGERFNLHHIAMGHLESRVERLGGSILDETALQRRLERIEDRLLESHLEDSASEKHPEGGV
jgi:methyl-accepting chemotaxis protein